MSNLISGKEALIALANGQEVEYENSNGWSSINSMRVDLIAEGFFPMRLKPRTITINGIKVPAPFEPKDGESCWVLSHMSSNGYQEIETYHSYFSVYINLGAWQTEDEIKQVVAALRSIFK